MPKRDAEFANAFIGDLASLLANRVQLTTDGHKAYLETIKGAFGSVVDYAMLVKQYGPGTLGDQRRYSPSEFVSAEKRYIVGAPGIAKVSTSYVERQNLTMRMSMRRFTRLTNGFSKKIENLEHAVSLHFMHHNFARIQKTLRVTPAMATGIRDHVWSTEKTCNLVPKPEAKKRGPYKRTESVQWAREH